MNKRLLFAVTTDLSYDQRMIRICTSLSSAGYQVTLVGRKQPASILLTQQPFLQKRLTCWFNKGKLFYVEYNLRLLIFLLFTKTDCIGAIDLDTIVPCYWASIVKRCKRVYDAHELFCEMKEIVTRPRIYRFWKWIERITVPKFTHGYTVNEPIAMELRQMYGVEYKVIRNIAWWVPQPDPIAATPPYFLYQGAVNEGRCFETLIPAMQWVDGLLWICGDGNFLTEAQLLVQQHQLQHKVIFKGKLPPDELRQVTRAAYAGITLFDDRGLSNYYSLANRFFDYLHAGIPQLCVDFPVYRTLNQPHPFALLVKDTSAQNLATELNNLKHNTVLYKKLQENCRLAQQQYNWQQEQQQLLAFYQNLFL